MAKGNGTAKAGNGRTAPIDVAGQNALGLAAAFWGLQHLFDAKVSGWDVTPEGIVAHDFTVAEPYSAEQIVHDINLKDRRAPLFPAIFSIMDPQAAPRPFESNLEITTFMVNFWKGSMGEDSSKVPEYVRTAASNYKERTGTKTKRGPKTRTINLKNVKDLNPDVLRNAKLSREDIEYLIKTASAVLDETETTEAGVEATLQEATA
jgi:hypothetical protein